jgi:two-component system OmpR family response regulator
MSFVILGKHRRTLLLVDPDPHFRAGLRLALEAAGFTVGEAANSKEGERTALRIRPDAILLDLMLETVDAGSLLAQRLREIGEKFPIFLISHAAGSLDYNLDLHSLGIAGVFAKPVNVAEMIGTLRRHLQAD